MTSATRADMREALRQLVDVVWNEATESTAVPSTAWADRLIAKVPALSQPQPEADACKDEDEAYDIGVRDGYESAVQDIDLATGGDGEFKGSTIPGQTVDVPAMKQRVIDRFKELSDQADADWNIRKYIDVLRAAEGDSVTVLCDNPDFNGQPNCAIECNGEWTDWQDKRFAGDTLLIALGHAYIECTQRREALSSEGTKSEGGNSGTFLGRSVM